MSLHLAKDDAIAEMADADFRAVGLVESWRERFSIDPQGRVWIDYPEMDE